MSATPPHETPARDLERIIANAKGAARWMAARTAAERRLLLEALALSVEANLDELVSIARSETHLGQARLEGEVRRAAGQFRLYGEAIEELQATEVDEPNPLAVPTPIPSLVRAKVPLGVVLVFAASNFPFAFSVCGTDVAAAIAAGCPVIVKAHFGHPRLSERTAELMGDALRDAGAPEGVFGLISGTEAGLAALRDDRVAAGAFTGSTTGGEFLRSVANERRIPIPFYCEMGSLNPVVVAPAAAARADEVFGGFISSFTLGAGQFCTKPGLLFWPTDAALPASLTESLAAVPQQTLLNGHIAAGYENVATGIFEHPGVDRVFGEPPTGSTLDVAPLLGITDTATLRGAHDQLLRECFGPAALIVRYQDGADLTRTLETLAGQLTGTVHADDADDEFIAEVLPLLAERVGRLIWGEWPTGVAVASAQHHGGPYPATANPLFTSVGPHAMERFWRPLTRQNFPARFL